VRNGQSTDLSAPPHSAFHDRQLALTRMPQRGFARVAAGHGFRIGQERKAQASRGAADRHHSATRRAPQTLGFRLDEQRLPDGAAKARVPRAVDRCKGALSLKPSLRLVRLLPARYHAWKRAEKRCELDDRSSCPRSHPTQLTPVEVSTIKHMVAATKHRHMPVWALALYAQRDAKVFASATTWAKLVRQRGRRRPRRRVYPEKPNGSHPRRRAKSWLSLHSPESFTQLEQLIDNVHGRSGSHDDGAARTRSFG